MANERVHVESDLWWQKKDGYFELYDSEGNLLGTLPGRGWTESQIKAAAQLANSFYAAGETEGKRDLQRDLRNLLGLNQ